MAWFFVVNNIDPMQAGVVGFLFFYISLFLSLTGTVSVIGFLIRKRMIKLETAIFHHVKHTFRQAILIAFVIILALFLLQVKLLTWWNSVILLILLFVAEGIIFTNRKYNNKDVIS